MPLSRCSVLIDYSQALTWIMKIIFSKLIWGNGLNFLTIFKFFFKINGFENHKVMKIFNLLETVIFKFILSFIDSFSDAALDQFLSNSCIPNAWKAWNSLIFGLPSLKVAGTFWIKLQSEFKILIWFQDASGPFILTTVWLIVIFLTWTAWRQRIPHTSAIASN